MSYMAQKRNRVLQITEEKAEEYASMGYEITDEDGRTVLRAALTTISDAKKAIAEAQKHIKELSQENESLKAALTEVKQQNEQLQKENAELKASQVSTTAVKPASKTAKKAE